MDFPSSLFDDPKFLSLYRGTNAGNLGLAWLTIRARAARLAHGLITFDEISSAIYLQMRDRRSVRKAVAELTRLGLLIPTEAGDAYAVHAPTSPARSRRIAPQMRHGAYAARLAARLARQLAMGPAKASGAGAQSGQIAPQAAYNADAARLAASHARPAVEGKVPVDNSLAKEAQKTPVLEEKEQPEQPVTDAECQKNGDTDLCVRISYTLPPEDPVLKHTTKKPTPAPTAARPTGPCRAPTAGADVGFSDQQSQTKPPPAPPIARPSARAPQEAAQGARSTGPNPTHKALPENAVKGALDADGFKQWMLAKGYWSPPRRRHFSESPWTWELDTVAKYHQYRGATIDELFNAAKALEASKGQGRKILFPTAYILGIIGGIRAQEAELRHPKHADLPANRKKATKPPADDVVRPEQSAPTAETAEPSEEERNKVLRALRTVRGRNGVVDFQALAKKIAEEKAM